MATYSPRVLSLCAGGGGLDLGIRLAVPDARTVCYLERDVTEAGVLGKGIEAGALDDAPIWSDLLTFDGIPWRGRVDCVAGGFPCQPHSYAGKRLGEFDERNLWPAVARLVSVIAPSVCFFENVPGIAAYYWRDIRPDLQALGYEVEEGIFSAAEVGASHLRERLYFMAYRQGAGSSYGRPGAILAKPAQGRSRLADADEGSRGTGHEQQHGQRANVAGRGCGNVADRDRLNGRQRDGTVEGRPSVVEAVESGAAPSGDEDGWQRWLCDWPGTEPAVRRDADGLASRADRLRVLGNGVVPVVAATAWRTLAARLGVG